jgi:hypothetical protein
MNFNRSFSRSPAHEQSYKLNQNDQYRSPRKRSPVPRERSTSAFKKARRDELPKTRMIKHPKNRRVLEKSFVSPTKNTEQVRRDYYHGNGFSSTNKKYTNSGHTRSFYTPGDELKNSIQDSSQGHVRSFQVDDNHHHGNSYTSSSQKQSYPGRLQSPRKW